MKLYSVCGIAIYIGDLHCLSIYLCVCVHLYLVNALNQLLLLANKANSV